MAIDFNLSGKTLENKDGMWGAEIVLTTPDGRVTKLESGFIFRDAESAKANLKFNLNRILKDFKKTGAKVVDYAEGEMQ